MRIIYLIILCTLISCGNRFQLHNNNEKTPLCFLSKNKGKVAILDESFEAYFSKLQIREIETFTQEKMLTNNLEEARNFARIKFASAVIDFTPSEKKCISFVAQQVDQIMREHNISLVANHPWKFIKIENWLCGGFAHTRGAYIIISQKHIDYLSKGWSDSMSEKERLTLIKRFGALLIHEKLHTLQREYKPIFDGLYKEKWGFVNAKVKDKAFVVKNQVSNPDAPIPEWIIPNEDNASLYYWIRTLLKPTDGIPKMGKDFIDIVFLVEGNNAEYTIQLDEELRPVTMDMSEFLIYKKL